MESQQSSPAVAQSLSAIVGAAYVSIDDAEREIFGADIFFERCPPLAIVRPGSISELAEVVGEASAQGLTVVARGAGLSYSAGYLSDRPDTLAVDTRRLSRIIEINREDLFVHVEAGVTWSQLNDALAEEGLRTPYWGTGSGLVATIGGTLSQNAINYGSALYGTSAESVLGLQVVLASGRVLHTGSWATSDDPTPFDRNYGPDLTGLFLGDCGALGIKAEAAIQLMPRPGAVRHAAYGFDQRTDMVAAMAEIGRQGLASEVYGFDPFFLSERIASTGFADDVQKMVGVFRGEGSLLAGMKEAVKVAAAGRRHLHGIGYSIHLAVEGRDDVEADNMLRYVESICSARTGKELIASVPKVMRGTPFPPPYMLLAPDGDRWVPTHGIIPHSRHDLVLDTMDAYMDSQRSLIDEHDLTWSQVSILVGKSRVLVEVNLYFKDRLTPTLESFLDDGFLATKKRYAENPAAWEAVNVLRDGLANQFRRLGATHLQIGRTYPYLDSRSEETRELLRTLKAHLDPAGRMNPGSLGL